MDITSDKELDMIFHSSGEMYSSKMYPDESHGSLPLIAYYDALHFIFDMYKRPSFVKLSDSSAGILCRHYKTVSQQLGYQILPPLRLVSGLAWRYRVDKRYAECEHFLTEIIKQYPGYAIAYNELGVLYEEQGNAVKAKAWYRKAKELK